MDSIESDSSPCLVKRGSTFSIASALIRPIGFVRSNSIARPALVNRGNDQIENNIWVLDIV